MSHIFGVLRFLDLTWHNVLDPTKSGYGRLKLVAASKSGMLVKLLNMLHGILYLSFLSWQFLGQDVLVLNTGLGNAEEQSRIKESLRVDESPLMDTAGNSISIVSWVQHEKHDGIRLKHLKHVSTVEWHRKGDYFTSVVQRDIL